MVTSCRRQLYDPRTEGEGGRGIRRGIHRVQSWRTHSLAQVPRSNSPRLQHVRDIDLGNARREITHRPALLQALQPKGTAPARSACTKSFSSRLPLQRGHEANVKREFLARGVGVFGGHVAAPDWPIELMTCAENPHRLRATATSMDEQSPNKASLGWFCTGKGPRVSPADFRV